MGIDIINALMRGQAGEELIDDARTSHRRTFSSFEIERRFEENIALQMANRLYEGVDLTAMHAAEIAAEPFYGNVWAWVQARIRSGNFRGINVGDYIPFEADGHTVVAEVAGINTYKGYGEGSNEVGSHMDFISRDCWHETRVWNRAGYNNGIAAMTTPFSMTVPPSKLFSWRNVTVPSPVLSRPPVPPIAPPANV